MIYRVTFVSHTGALEIATVLHVEATGDDWLTPTPTPQQVADQVNTKMQAPYRNLLTTAYTFDRIDASTVTDPADPNQVPLHATHVVNAVGTRAPADSDLPPRICGMLRLNTALGGRSFRGRMFGPPLEGKAAIVSDLISATNDYTLAMNAFGDMIADANLAAGSSWGTLWSDTWHGRFVVYSPTRHRQGATPHAADVTSYTNTRRLAYLSSRDR